MSSNETEAHTQTASDVGLSHADAGTEVGTLRLIGGEAGERVKTTSDPEERGRSRSRDRRRRSDSSRERSKDSDGTVEGGSSGRGRSKSRRRSRSRSRRRDGQSSRSDRSTKSDNSGKSRTSAQPRGDSVPSSEGSRIASQPKSSPNAGASDDAVSSDEISTDTDTDSSSTSTSTSSATSHSTDTDSSASRGGDTSAEPEFAPNTAEERRGRMEARLKPKRQHYTPEYRARAEKEGRVLWNDVRHPRASRLSRTEVDAAPGDDDQLQAGPGADQDKDTAVVSTVDMASPPPPTAPSSPGEDKWYTFADNGLSVCVGDREIRYGRRFEVDNKTGRVGAEKRKQPAWGLDVTDIELAATILSNASDERVQNFFTNYESGLLERIGKDLVVDLELHAVRHGTTNMNYCLPKAERFRGYDPSLTELGIAECRDMARRKALMYKLGLLSVPDAEIISTLQRTQETNAESQGLTLDTVDKDGQIRVVSNALREQVSKSNTSRVEEIIGLASYDASSKGRSDRWAGCPRENLADCATRAKEDIVPMLAKYSAVLAGMLPPLELEAALSSGTPLKQTIELTSHCEILGEFFNLLDKDEERENGKHCRPGNAQLTKYGLQVQMSGIDFWDDAWKASVSATSKGMELAPAKSKDDWAKYLPERMRESEEAARMFLGARRYKRLEGDELKKSLAWSRSLGSDVAAAA